VYIRKHFDLTIHTNEDIRPNGPVSHIYIFNLKQHIESDVMNMKEI